MTVHALILAGGRGSRLGDVRKGEIRIGGRTLFTRIAQCLPGMPLLVSTGPGDAPELGWATAIGDGNDGFDGPIAGIRAALRHLDGSADADDLLLSVAVDTPFLPPDFPARMIAALAGGADAAYAAWGSAIYPTNALYRLTALRAAPLPDSPRRLLAGLDAVRVDWTAQEKADPFANLNTLADLIALGRRARIADE